MPSTRTLPTIQRMAHEDAAPNPEATDSATGSPHPVDEVQLYDLDDEADAKRFEAQRREDLAPIARDLKKKCEKLIKRGEQ